MLSIFPQETRVILIGASNFPKDPEHLPKIPAVVSNIRDLEKLLSDPRIIGIPQENIHVILDKENATNVLEELAKVCREAEDSLIVYYSGHGLVGKTSSQLLLATSGTTDKDSEYNGISFDGVRKAIGESIAKKKILILDCCFSGRALDIMGSETALLQSNLDIKGTYAIASAPANQPAIAPPGEKYTAFTGELLRVLNEGVDNGKEEISLQEIYDCVRTELHKNPKLPEPRSANVQDAGKLLIARNRKSMISLEKTINNLRESIEITQRRLAEVEKDLNQRINGLNSSGAPTVRVETYRFMLFLKALGYLSISLVPSCLFYGGIYMVRTYTLLLPFGLALLLIEILLLTTSVVAYNKPGGNLYFNLIFGWWATPVGSFISALLGSLILLLILLSYVARS